MARANSRNAGRMNKTNFFRMIAEHNREVKVERRRRSVPLFQSGRIQTPAGLAMDARLHALPPGKRRSASGHTYYERRANRSDQHYATGL